MPSSKMAPRVSLTRRSTRARTSCERREREPARGGEAAGVIGSSPRATPAGRTPVRAVRSRRRTIRSTPHPPGAQAKSLAAIRFLERALIEAPLEGIVLRYGSLYGPGALRRARGARPGTEAADARLPATGFGHVIHLDDAAAATVAAARTRWARASTTSWTTSRLRSSEWLPYLAEEAGAKPPRARFLLWLGRMVAGEVAVSFDDADREARRTPGQSASSAGSRAGRSWREGFRHGLTDEAARAGAR